MRIGGNSIWGEYFQGAHLTMCAIYNRALSQTELTADMNTPVSAPVGSDGSRYRHRLSFKRPRPVVARRRKCCLAVFSGTRIGSLVADQSISKNQHSIRIHLPTEA